MQSLSPEARARLAAFRRAESPAEADADRCLAALEQRLAAAPARPRRRAAIVVGAGLALAAGLLVALRWAATPARDDGAAGLQAPYQVTPEPPAAPETREALRGTAPTAATSATASTDATSAVASPDASSASANSLPANWPGATASDATSSTTTASDPTLAGATASEPTATASDTGSPTATSSGAGDAAASASPVPQARRPRERADTDIAAEVALLREAKLAAGGARLQLLAEHARRFPSGAFAAERELLVAETRCELGEVAAARALVARFPQRFPNSPLAARVAKICAGTPDP